MIFDQREVMRIRQAALTMCLLVSTFCASPIVAATRIYEIDSRGSLVQFAWDFGKAEVLGSMPVVRADLSIDFQAPARSRISVALDASHAQAGFVFATQAMRGPRVLDTRRFPSITFASTRITRTAPSAAMIDGNITIRGVTRPIRLHAEFYKQRGSKAADLSSLTILLTGAISRSEFGASGWSDLAGDEVRLRVLARIHRVD